jgi:hypothetical protein
LLVLVLVAMSLAPAGTSSASCSGPTISVGDRARPTLAAGDPVTVDGRSFVDGCDDQGGAVLGCGQVEPEPVVPDKDVVLRLQQSGRSWELGTSDAGTREDNKVGHVAWQVRVPAEVRPGRATLVAGDARLPVEVTRRE